mmetsp:Transcript_72811/g.236530  ORF Transcript_72811/g.236530 Transcript_72811/m.236530 type:complete len:330 (+) Transcript_72811:811-1800(+)
MPGDCQGDLAGVAANVQDLEAREAVLAELRGQRAEAGVHRAGLRRCTAPVAVVVPVAPIPLVVAVVLALPSTGAGSRNLPIASAGPGSTGGGGGSGGGGPGPRLRMPGRRPLRLGPRRRRRRRPLRLSIGRRRRHRRWPGRRKRRRRRRLLRLQVEERLPHEAQDVHSSAARHLRLHRPRHEGCAACHSLANQAWRHGRRQGRHGLAGERLAALQGPQPKADLRVPRRRGSKGSGLGRIGTGKGHIDLALGCRHIRRVTRLPEGSAANRHPRRGSSAQRARGPALPAACVREAVEARQASRTRSRQRVGGGQWAAGVGRPWLTLEPKWL